MVRTAQETHRQHAPHRHLSATPARTQRAARNRIALAVESLEPRLLLNADTSLLPPAPVPEVGDTSAWNNAAWVETITGNVHVLQSPDTQGAVANSCIASDHALHSDTAQAQIAEYQASTRWASTSTDGGDLSWGDATNLTWSIVPDGTPIPGFIGESTGTSNFVAFMNNIYGSVAGTVAQQPWFPIVASVFERWSEVSGLQFVYEPRDDGAAYSDYSSRAPGVVGVRGDIRIGGHTIDGPSGTLAYNFFPDNGEMVLDTSDSFFFDTANNSLKLRNVMAHEAGHGIGLSHVEPVNGTKLMEPIATTAFDGPQQDDILAAHRMYGDRLESGSGNDQASQASPLGALDGRSVSVGNPVYERYVSIDGASDVDYYHFTASAGTQLDVRLTPLGDSYLQGAVGTTPTSFTSRAANNLELHVYNSQHQLVAKATSRPAGEVEAIQDLTLGGGTYYVAVRGSQDAAQLYQLNVNVSETPLGENVDFDQYTIQSYGGRQDHSGTAATGPDGKSLRLAGNRWVMIDFPYRVTQDTVLAFDFASSAEGEVHGIGFDSNSSISSGLTFRLFGTQNWGRDAYATYDRAQGFYHFEIPVGQFYTGNAAHLVFVNDHDVAHPSAESVFSNVRVYERLADRLAASSASGHVADTGVANPSSATTASQYVALAAAGDSPATAVRARQTECHPPTTPRRPQTPT